MAPRNCHSVAMKKVLFLLGAIACVSMAPSQAAPLPVVEQEAPPPAPPAPVPDETPAPGTEESKERKVEDHIAPQTGEEVKVDKGGQAAEQGAEQGAELDAPLYADENVVEWDEYAETEEDRVTREKQFEEEYQVRWRDYQAKHFVCDLEKMREST